MEGQNTEIGRLETEHMPLMKLSTIFNMRALTINMLAQRSYTLILGVELPRITRIKRLLFMLCGSIYESSPIKIQLVRRQCRGPILRHCRH